MTTADWLRAKIGPAPHIDPSGVIAERVPSGRQGAQDEFGFFSRYLRPDMRVLHANFGDGSRSLQLASHLPMGDLVGIDPELSNVRAARNRKVRAGNAELSFERGSLDDLPFAAAEFDAVLLDGSLSVDASAEKALEEAMRVLTPGGLLGARHMVAASRVFTGPSPLLERALRRRETVQRDLGGDPDFGLRQPALLRTAGFVNLRVTSSTEQRTDEELLSQLASGGFVPGSEDGSDMEIEDSQPVISFVTVIECVAWRPA